MGIKVAVAIGVGGTGETLPVLEGAREDARAFAEWAGRPGADGKPLYKTKLVVDSPLTIVTFDDLRREIGCLLQEDVDRLLLFFSGHGVSTQAGDFWLLSHHHRDPDEAVNVALSVRNARRQPIGQIAVFSDACRSALNTSAFMGGRSLFQIAWQPARRIAQYDEFFSTDVGAVAQEVGAAGVAKAYGVFSKCLFRALHGTIPDALEQRDGSGVVTSERLAQWLGEAVPLETGKIPGGVVQTPWLTPGWIAPNDIYSAAPVTMVGSNDVARILGAETGAPGVPVAVGRAQLEAARDKIAAAEADRAHKAAAREASYQAMRGRHSFETHQGLSVTGAEVIHVVTGPGRQTDRFQEDGLWHVRGYDGPQSVALELNGGRWVPATILPGFVASLVVGSDGVESVNYAPARGAGSRDESLPVEHEVARWNALLSTGRSTAAPELTRFADQLRITKHINPAFGILAAYAYDRAGRLADIESVADYFARENGFVPFDVAFLTETLRQGGPAPNGAPIAGGFPLLSYGWSLLDPDLTAIPRTLLKIRTGLLNGPWAAFDARWGVQFADLVARGEV